MLPTPLARPLVLALALTLGACGGDSAETLIEKARASEAAGDLRGAEIAYKSALQADEDNGLARLELGELYLSQNAYPQAEKELRKARQAGQDKNRIDPLLARALIGMGEFQRVIDEMSLIDSRAPTAVPLLLARSQAQAALGKVEDARLSVDEAGGLAPQSADVSYTLAQLALAERNLPLAMERLEEALTRDPGHRDSWLMKADLQRMSGKLDDARKGYEAALRIDPRHHDARIAMAGLDITDGRLEQARKEIDQVLGERPGHPLANYAMAALEFREQRYAEARDRLARVLKASPNYLPAVLLEGANSFMLGNMSTAETSLKRVTAAIPNNLYAQRLLIASVLKQGRTDEAADMLSRIDLAKANDPGLYVVAAEIATLRRDPEQAARYLQTASRLNPDSAALRTELGLAQLAAGDDDALPSLREAATSDTSGRADVAIITKLLSSKRYDDALKSIDALEKKLPKAPMVWNFRGAAQLAKGDLDAARKSFERAVALQADFFPAANNLAQMDLKARNIKAAESRFETVLKASPKHTRAMLALAQLRQARGDDAGFVTLVRKAIATEPAAAELHVALIRHYVQRKNAQEALAAARVAQDAQPQNPAVLEAVGQAQMLAEEPGNALATYRKLVEVSTDKVRARVQLAAAEMAAREYSAARNTLAEVLKSAPKSLEARALLADLEIRTNRPEAALTQAREMARIAPRNPSAARAEGAVLMQLKRYDEALAAYDRLHALQPGSDTIALQSAALTAAGKADVADKRLTAWLAKNPADHAARALYAESLLSRKQYAAAIKEYLQIEKAAPGNAMVQNNLAWALYQARDARALEYAEKARKTAPKNPAVLDTYGWILANSGKPGQAVEPLRTALKLAPGSPDIRWHLAWTLNASGDRDGAKRELDILFERPVNFAEIDAARQLHTTLTR